MDMTGRPEDSGQTLHLDGRRSLTVCGTEDVLSFDDSTVTLQTTQGKLHVDGCELHILSLNAAEYHGSIQIEGRIDGLFYEDETVQKKSSVFGRRRQ